MAPLTPTLKREPMSEFFDILETRPHEQRERSLMAALPGTIAKAIALAPAIAQQLHGVDPTSVDSRQALARLPVLRKHELLERQHCQSRRCRVWQCGESVRRIFDHRMGPGLASFCVARPDLRTRKRTARLLALCPSLYAAGFRPGELSYNCFSYHFTPAGSMMETAAHAVGCTVFPGGTG